MFFRPAVFVTLVGLVSVNALEAVAEVPACRPGGASGAQASGVMKIDYDAPTGKLWVEAAAADFGVLLGKIAQKSGIAIEVDAGIAKKVSISFSGLPLEQGVNAIVDAAGEGNLAAEYTKQPDAGAGSFKLEKIVVLKEGTSAAPAATAGGGAMPVHVRKDAGALGELLREYGDPNTTRDEKLKLRRSIRRSARTPEEKTLLKSAVLDPRNRGEVAEDLQMALTQSMQEHPEGSDKAFVLGLLRRESSPGPLVRAMVGSGDPTYVNYLLSAAQAGDLHAIELIGNLRVAPAVPVLEHLAAAPGNGSPARHAAATALRRLGAVPADPAGGARVWEEKPNR